MNCRYSLCFCYIVPTCVPIAVNRHTRSIVPRKVGRNVVGNDIEYEHVRVGIEAIVSCALNIIVDSPYQH